MEWTWIAIDRINGTLCKDCELVIV
jgi:hypothetical protein